ncbi:response regulator transcription factor [Flavobacterium rhamnosiphilum]|uniref:Response regulator transcription factor n=1 Tax=Flavobacterium rhamnosiphilum TaxID=2541724 RepID=A0A4R5F9R8_9FLAO|nr:response regulator transcription factor [Flavobacterium rhamnosiphilum]
MRPNYKILIIDDNTIDQIVTKQLLKKTLDITDVSTANNGKEGIQWLIDHGKSFEESLIILLDIKMPEMDGFEFLLEYETLPEELKKETQIFMLSSTLDPNDITQAKNNKYVKTLLSKPLPIKEFGEMIYPDSSPK